ncbi:MAG: ABC transporter ATP-binding protein [Actinobacteria bacterium]|nr:ABC transporter ATP-binding protein [Actinomycetota bacterium]
MTTPPSTPPPTPPSTPPPSHEALGDTPLLRVERLSVHYGGVVALDDVSFDVSEGTIVGLIGPNGAGKTTCLDALTGFQPATHGSVYFDTNDVTSLAPHRRARHGFVRTFQSLDLFDDLTVRQNLDVGAVTPTWRDTVLDALMPRRRHDAAVDEALELTGIASLAERHTLGLSNGQRHLVALARALVARPRLLLLDEPAAGLDENESATLAATLRRLPERGITVLLVEHDMSLVFGVCDRVHVLDLGRRIASGTAAEVRANPLVVDAYLGTGERHDEPEAAQ